MSADWKPLVEKGLTILAAYVHNPRYRKHT